MTTIDIDEPAAGRRAGPGTGTTVRLVDDGVHVLTLTVAAGGRLRLPSQAPPSYSFRDGVLRRTTWTTSAEGIGGRPGGATLVLGDHPMADELRSLGLPKRALFSSSAAQMRASFGGAEVVGPTAAGAAGQLTAPGGPAPVASRDHGPPSHTEGRQTAAAI